MAQASAEKNETDREVAGFEALWGPSCKYALIAGLGLVTLQQVTRRTKENCLGAVFLLVFVLSTKSYSNIVRERNTTKCSKFMEKRHYFVHPPPPNTNTKIQVKNDGVMCVPSHVSFMVLLGVICYPKQSSIMRTTCT